MNDSIWTRPGSLAEKFWRDGKADIPIYDMHCHGGTISSIYFKNGDMESMIQHMRSIGVRRTAFCHFYAQLGNWRNEEDYKICLRYPDFLRMYVVISPKFPEQVKEELASFDRWAPYAIGLKVLPDYHLLPLNDPAYEYALKFADERGLPVLCHTWGFSQYDGGAIMLEVAQKYPRIRFFIAHCIYGEWEYTRRIVTETPGNVWLDLTCIPGERNRIEELVSYAGSERVIFGTDLPWFDEYQAVGGVLSAKISEDDMKNILYRNVEKILGENW